MNRQFCSKNLVAFLWIIWAKTYKKHQTGEARLATFGPEIDIDLQNTCTKSY